MSIEYLLLQKEAREFRRLPLRPQHAIHGGQAPQQRRSGNNLRGRRAIRRVIGPNGQR